MSMLNDRPNVLVANQRMKYETYLFFLGLSSRYTNVDLSERWSFGIYNIMSNA